ncbi:hypothetical protein [Brevundimonas sp.]|uniref:hypothetical protein n=1 Tax=Brevundimonas sp. TaxID=1871086 RepID=UPI002EDA1235
MLFSEIDTQQSIRQGDVFKSYNNQKQDGWYILVTADCDVVNDKFGDKLTFIKVSESRIYMDNWYEKQCHIETERSSKEVCSTINSNYDFSNFSYNEFTPQDVISWVSELGCEDFISGLALPTKIAKSLEKKLIAIEIGSDKSKPSRIRFSEISDALGRTDNQKSKIILGGLKGMGGDHLFLPSIPGDPGIGFIVELRNIYTANPSQVFKDTVGRKLSGELVSFERCGRLADFLRFSVVQQFASLFSRIGMTEKFESEREIAMDLIAGDLNGQA